MCGLHWAERCETRVSRCRCSLTACQLLRTLRLVAVETKIVESLRVLASLQVCLGDVQKEDMSKVEHKAEQPQPKYRKDYKPTPYLIERLHLDFQLNEESTKVVATSQVKPNHSGATAYVP